MSAELQKHSNPNYQIDRPTLTLRQKRFIRYYVETFNATKAARLAGYLGNDVTLASVGYENLRKPQIVSEINRLCNPIADAEEVLQRLTKHSRARISDVLTDAGEFDLQTAKDNDADDLIKKLKIRKTRRTTPQGETIEEVTQDVELHDAQAATVQLARAHKLLTDRVELETSSVDVNIDLVELRAAIHALVQTEPTTEYEAALRLAEELEDVPELAAQLREWATGLASQQPEQLTVEHPSLDPSANVALLSDF